VSPPWGQRRSAARQQVGIEQLLDELNASAHSTSENLGPEAAPPPVPHVPPSRTASWVDAAAARSRLTRTSGSLLAACLRARHRSAARCACHGEQGVVAVGRVMVAAPVDGVDHHERGSPARLAMTGAPP